MPGKGELKIHDSNYTRLFAAYFAVNPSNEKSTLALEVIYATHAPLNPIE